MTYGPNKEIIHCRQLLLEKMNHKMHLNDYIDVTMSNIHK